MLTIHPAAELFPLIEGAEFQALVEDIRKHGLRDPIVTFKNQILDGRNRYRACQTASVQPKFCEWDEDGDVVEYVVSKNLHRRHLNESQRAVIGAQIANIKHGEVGGSHQKAETQISISEAATLLNVSKASISEARTVLNHGTEEEVAAVKAGAASVTTIGRRIRAERPKQQKRDEPLSQSGKNPERIQRQQINAEIWGRVRDALTHLTSLPMAADVAAIARANDRTGLVDARLQSAIQWLGDFHEEWNKRNAA